MNDPRDHVPAYRTIRVTAPEAPAAVAADTEAWRAHARYPDLRFAGPVFGVAREREEGGWEAYPQFSALAPQDARDSMGSVFRRLAPPAPSPRARPTMALPGPARRAAIPVLRRVS